MTGFPHGCVEDTNGKTVTAKENGRVFAVTNPARKLIQKVRIDNCVISNVASQKACDYGLWIHQETPVYLVELKGSDIVHGCNQITGTISYLRTAYPDMIASKSLMAVVVCSSNNVPRLRQNPAYVRLKRLVVDVVIRTNKHQVVA